MTTTRMATSINRTVQTSGFGNMAKSLFGQPLTKGNVDFKIATSSASSSVSNVEKLQSKYPNAQLSAESNCFRQPSSFRAIANTLGNNFQLTDAPAPRTHFGGSSATAPDTFAICTKPQIFRAMSPENFAPEIIEPGLPVVSILAGTSRQEISDKIDTIRDYQHLMGSLETISKALEGVESDSERASLTKELSELISTHSDILSKIDDILAKIDDPNREPLFIIKGEEVEIKDTTNDIGKVIDEMGASEKYKTLTHSIEQLAEKLNPSTENGWSEVDVENVVIRTMPNLCSEVGAGVMGVLLDEKMANDPRVQDFLAIMKETNILVTFDNEENLHWFTAIAGSGPAFDWELVKRAEHLISEALSDAGQEVDHQTVKEASIAILSKAINENLKSENVSSEDGDRLAKSTPEIDASETLAHLGDDLIEQIGRETTNFINGMRKGALSENSGENPLVDNDKLTVSIYGTALGSLKQYDEETELPLEKLQANVRSKKGTTDAGLNVVTARGDATEPHYGNTSEITEEVAAEMIIAALSRSKELAAPAK